MANLTGGLGRGPEAGHALTFQPDHPMGAGHVRYGYRRLHVLLWREGWPVNHKGVHRL